MKGRKRERGKERKKERRDWKKKKVKEIKIYKERESEKKKGYKWEELERKRDREKERKERKKDRSIYLFITLEILFIVVGGIPDLEDISKTSDTFWKETTYNKLIDGSDGGNKVRVYKHQGSSFLRCHNIEYNHESIHILQDDETISDGIYRIRFADGDTAIGSRYFRRSGREEGRMYRLYRFIDYGNIYYYDEIYGKDGSGWRDLAKYSFNQETLDWTKN